MRIDKEVMDAIKLLKTRCDEVVCVGCPFNEAEVQGTVICRLACEPKKYPTIKPILHYEIKE